MVWINSAYVKIIQYDQHTVAFIGEHDKRGGGLEGPGHKVKDPNQSGTGASTTKSW